jgi:hypothetical protein
VSLTDESILDQGYDAIVDFQPNRSDFPAATSLRSLTYVVSRKLLPDAIYQRLKLMVSANNIVDYRKMVSSLIAKPWPSSYRKFPCVFPSWDNTARRRTPTIIQNDDAKVYGNWLRHSLSVVEDYSPFNRLVFINAWNEWAEGCHLEPDQRSGRRFLEVTAQARAEASDVVAA